jgi:hypothetical protein
MLEVWNRRGWDSCRERRATRVARSLEPTRTATNERERVSGGEGGIRTPHDLLDSVSCRYDIAANAVNANDAVAPRTRLHPTRSTELR